MAKIRFTFDQHYPFSPARFQYTGNRGLDTEQFQEILDLANLE